MNKYNVNNAIPCTHLLPSDIVSNCQAGNARSPYRKMAEIALTAFTNLDSFGNANRLTGIPEQLACYSKCANFTLMAAKPTDRVKMIGIGRYTTHAYMVNYSNEIIFDPYGVKDWPNIFKDSTIAWDTSVRSMRVVAHHIIISNVRKSTNTKHS